jgi:hypothetical protein
MQGMFDLFLHGGTIPNKVCVCKLFGKFDSDRETPSTENDKDTIKIPVTLVRA